MATLLGAVSELTDLRLPEKSHVIAISSNYETLWNGSNPCRARISWLPRLIFDLNNYNTPKTYLA